MSDELNIKDIIEKTKNFDQPYAPAIPEGIHEVELTSVERKLSAKGYDMIVIYVADAKGRTSRVTQMLELQWIDGTIRLIKGLYTHNVPAEEKEDAKEKINKVFDNVKSAKELQDKCVDILQKLINKGCIAWLRVERQNPEDQYPDRALTAYEPTYRWKTAADEAKDIVDNSEAVTEDIDDIFAS